MPRRQFLADLKDAQLSLPPTVSDLQRGDDDGHIVLSIVSPCTSANGSSATENINVVVPDLGDYPKGHEYMIFASDDASPPITRSLQNIRKPGGKTVSEVVLLIASTVTKFSLDGTGALATESQSAETDEEDDDDYDFDGYDGDMYDSDHEAFDVHDRNKKLNDSYSQDPSDFRAGLLDKSSRDRIRSDLRITRDSGYKVGALGHLLAGHNAFVTVSIRVSKLGISEEALEAWQMDYRDYLILILRYPSGYKTNEVLQGYDSIQLSSCIGMRVVTSRRYKPTLQEAIAAFAVARKGDHDPRSAGGDNLSKGNIDANEIRDTFISTPLVAFLQERFVPILRLRAQVDGWDAAEQRYNAMVDSGGRSDVLAADKPFDSSQSNAALPEIVNADHYKLRTTTHAFPLLTMQFLLRHFVRCTEFCLVCHRKMNTDVEAIKPYVCDSGLCLYQYMTLGFGPKIEHEITTQPYVVDLLVSFLYNSASTGKLNSFPDGLSILVPPPDMSVYTVPDLTDKPAHRTAPALADDQHHNVPRHPSNAGLPESVYKVGFDEGKKELIFFEKPAQCPVKRGDWIVLRKTDISLSPELHCRVTETSFYPVLHIDEPIALEAIGPTNTDTGSATNAKEEAVDIKDASSCTNTPQWAAAAFTIYCKDFDSLDRPNKCLAICRILNTLADVKAMRDYLIRDQRAELRSWAERVSPAAMSILRWCIASNRACIMEVDQDPTFVTTKLARKRERLSGMKDYMQFRFAMGAPDKEQRFIDEVRTTTQRLQTKYPTLFAWHGSPLYNWHMIIREGLHFKTTVNGRAFGHGVYHAKHAVTSAGYTGMHGGYGYGGNSQAPSKWTSSLLRISTAVALNEIVNAPSEFISSNPHFVVQHLDWIQTRYLFVQVSPKIKIPGIGTDVVPSEAFAQDPNHIPLGVSGAIVIPAAAIKMRAVGKRSDNANRNSHTATIRDKKGKSSHGLHSSPTAAMPRKKNKVKIDSNDTLVQSQNVSHNGVLADFDIPERDLGISPNEFNDDSDSVCTTQSDREILFEEDDIDGYGDAKRHGPLTDFMPGTLCFDTLPLMPIPTYAVSSTTKRLLKELHAVRAVQAGTATAELGWYIEAEKIDNVYQWIVELHSFHNFEISGKQIPLAEDMKKHDVRSIVMEIRFNKDFPYTPPYVRVVRPRFRPLAQGGGGHIVMGGAMCMELLTNSGWSSVSSMESVLMQVRLAIASEPFARLDAHIRNDYGAGEAADGYIRACRTHGWEVPPGFKEMAYGITEK